MVIVLHFVEQGKRNSSKCSRFYLEYINHYSSKGQYTGNFLFQANKP